jgi:hypothetical protein
MQAHRLSLDKIWTALKMTVLLLLRVLDAAGTSLPSLCLSMKEGIHFTEPLPSNDKGIHIQTHRLMGGIYEARR